MRGLWQLANWRAAQGRGGAGGASPATQLSGRWKTDILMSQAYLMHSGRLGGRLQPLLGSVRRVNIKVRLDCRAVPAASLRGL